MKWIPLALPFLSATLAACSISRTSTRFFEPGIATPRVECDKTTVDWKPDVLAIPAGAVLAYTGANWLSVLAVTVPGAVARVVSIPAVAVDNLTTATTAAKECAR